MNSDPDIIEAAARALRDKVGSATFAGRSNLLPLSLDDLAQAVLAAVTPIIRAQAFEEAAREILLPSVIPTIEAAALERAAEMVELSSFSPRQWPNSLVREIAAAIRALKEQP